jgi:DNA-binding transcriptional LysR family regulator
MPLSLKNLKCFRAVMDAGSVTAAADSLSITQPAVSRMLRQLEADIGFELFTRTKGRLIPTDSALALFAEVDVALQSVDRVSQLALNLRNHDYGELSFVSPPSFAERVLTRLVAEFVLHYPNVRVSLDSRHIDTALDMVALRAVDCGFARLPVDHPDLECETLISSGTVCVMKPDHPLSKRRRITAVSLTGEPLILLGRGRASRSVLNEGFDAAHVRPRIRIETHTVSAACSLARLGAGIAIVNGMLAAQYLERDLVMRDFSPKIRHDYALVTSTNAPMTRIGQRFRDFCKTFFNDNPDPNDWAAIPRLHTPETPYVPPQAMP